MGPSVSEACCPLFSSPTHWLSVHDSKDTEKTRDHTRQDTQRHLSKNIAYPEDKKGETLSLCTEFLR